VSRVGLMEDTSARRYPPPYLLGVEYENDFFTDVLLLPVPQEVAGNLLSQIESTFSIDENSSVTPFEEF